MARGVGDDGVGLPPPLRRWVRAGVWLLPVWGLFLAASTVTHQPDYKTDFEDYADYITTAWFLVSHLVFSIFGAALAVIGGTALGLRLATTAASRSAMWGMAAFSAAQVPIASVFGVAAFFQPAVGRAFEDGAEAAARSINEDVYGPAVFATVGIGLLLMIIGAILLGRGAATSGAAPRWAGWLFAVAVPVFAIAGFTIEILQPIAGLAVAISGFGLARAASISMADDASTSLTAA